MKENKSQDHTQSHPDQKKTWGKGPGHTVTDVVGLMLREDTENEGGGQGLEGPAQLNLSQRRFKSPEQFLIWERVPGGDGTVLTCE